MDSVCSIAITTQLTSKFNILLTSENCLTSEAITDKSNLKLK
jgi:hypothetical protein